jgi:hypothetical protein
MQQSACRFTGQNRERPALCAVSAKMNIMIMNRPRRKEGNVICPSGTTLAWLPQDQRRMSELLCIRLDAKYDRDSSVCQKTGSFRLPVKRSRKGEYVLTGGETVYTCFTSDFFVEDADEWRAEAWAMIRERQDLNFFYHHEEDSPFPRAACPAIGATATTTLPSLLTVENQARAADRLPVFMKEPIKHKSIYLRATSGSDRLSPPILAPRSGRWWPAEKSGGGARVCDYDWVLNLREQC